MAWKFDSTEVTFDSTDYTMDGSGGVIAAVATVFVRLFSRITRAVRLQSFIRR